MRERRRQRGLPLPLAEKVLPFRASQPSFLVEPPEAFATCDAEPPELETEPETEPEQTA